MGAVKPSLFFKKGRRGGKEVRERERGKVGRKRKKKEKKREKKGHTFAIHSDSISRALATLPEAVSGSISYEIGMAVVACGWVICLFTGAEATDHSGAVFVWMLV